AVVGFAKEHNIIVLHDAAYSEFYFEGTKPSSFLATPGAKEVGMEINSLSKSFSMAGARIAYIAGHQEMIAGIKRLKSNLDYGVFAPIQAAGVVALNHAEEITANVREIFKARYEIMANGLKNLGWQLSPSKGGMFIWAAYPYEMDTTDFVIETIQ